MEVVEHSGKLAELIISEQPTESRTMPIAYYVKVICMTSSRM